MKSTRLLLTAMAVMVGLAALCAPPAQAADPRPYLLLSGGAVYQDTDRAGLADEIDMETGYSVGAAAGLDYRVGRLELEAVYRDCDVDEVELLDVTYDGDGDISTFALMANAYYVWQNDTIFQPYALAGIGGAYIDLDSISAGGVEFVDADDTQLAFQFGGGIELDLDAVVKVGLEYRYFRLSNEEFKDGAGNKFNYGYETHNAQASLRILF